MGDDARRNQSALGVGHCFVHFSARTGLAAATVSTRDARISIANDHGPLAQIAALGGCVAKAPEALLTTPLLPNQPNYELMPRRDSMFHQALALRPEGMGRKVVSGAGYQFAGIVLRTLVTVASTAALARLLTPADFGYIAMATVVTEFAALFSNFGFNALLIQRKVMTRLQADTVFWASLALGTTLALAVLLVSFFTEALFADPRVGELLRILCLSFVLSSLCTIPNVVLVRLMRFRAEFHINISAIVIRTSVAIWFAWAGLGVWSLVAGALTGTLVQVVLSFSAVPFWPRLRFNKRYLAGSWRTSSSYFAGGLLFFANMNVDLILIGRHLGATSLGYYQNARSLTEEIRSRIAMPIQQVLFPALSSLQADKKQIQVMVLRSGRLLAAVTFPLGVGVSAMAEELVPVLYGPQWLPMVPALGMFGLSAALRASVAIAAPLFNAHDKVSLALRYSVISAALMVAGIWLTLPYGITAVAISVTLVSTYTLVPFLAAMRLVGFGAHQAAQILGPPALASAIFWLVIFVLRPYTMTILNSTGAALVAHALIAAAVYALALHMIDRQYFIDLRFALFHIRRR